MQNTEKVARATHVARYKEHDCSNCSKKIKSGERYVRIVEIHRSERQVTKIHHPIDNPCEDIDRRSRNPNLPQNGWKNGGTNDERGADDH